MTRLPQDFLRRLLDYPLRGNNGCEPDGICRKNSVTTRIKVDLTGIPEWDCTTMRAGLTGACMCSTSCIAWE